MLKHSSTFIMNTTRERKIHQRSGPLLQGSPTHDDDRNGPPLTYRHWLAFKRAASPPRLWSFSLFTAPLNVSCIVASEVHFKWVTLQSIWVGPKSFFSSFFKKNGPIPASFCLFSLFSRLNPNTNWKKRRWCAWDSNPGLQDGRRKRNHRAMAATQDQKVITQRLQGALILFLTHVQCYQILKSSPIFFFSCSKK